MGWLDEKIQLLANVVESSDDAIISKSLDGVITSWNKGAELIYGYSAEEIIGKNISILAPPQLKDEVNQLINKIKDKERVSHYDTFRITKDRNHVDVSITMSPIFDNIGNLIGISTIARDITKQKKAEISLKKSAKRFHAVAESAIDAIVTTDENGKIIFFNNSLNKIFGYTKEEITGKPLTILMPTRYHKNYLIALQNFKESGKHRIIGKTITTIGLKKDKTEFPFEMSLSTWKSEQKTYFTSIIRDLSERKKAEKELLESEGLLRGLFDNMPSGMSVYQVQNDGSNGSDYIIKEFNLASQKIEGMKREDVIGKSLKDIRPEIDEYGLIPIFKKVRDTGKPIHYPAKIYVDEKYANYYENYVFKAPKGEIVAIYEDVTKKENAKEALQKQTAEKVHANILLKAEIKEREKKDKIIQDNVRRLKIALESADMGAWDLNLEKDTSIRTLDHDKIFGHDTLLPEWGTKIYFEHILPEDREHVQQEFEKSYKTNKLYFKCRITRPDKEIRWIEVYGNVYRNEKSVPIRILGVVSDITESKEAETHLLRAIDEKEMLLREIHHRVKNNMQIISSFLSLQSSQVFDNRDANLFTNVQDRVKSMSLIHDNLYKSEDLSSIQFKEYVKTLISQLFSTHSELSNNIKLVTDIFDVTFNMETAMPLGLIISEMVTNSLKHAFPDFKGEISISLQPKGEETELIIKDNGVGVPKDFDIKKPGKLGLQLLNILVEQLEGTIKLDRNHGTEFKITFKELKYKERI